MTAWKVSEQYLEEGIRAVFGGHPQAGLHGGTSCAPGKASTRTIHSSTTEEPSISRRVEATCTHSELWLFEAKRKKGKVPLSYFFFLLLFEEWQQKVEASTFL